MLGAAAWPAPDPAPLSAADAVRAAAADLRRVAKADPATAFQTRYVSAHNIPPADRGETYAVLAYHCNAISRAPAVAPPRRVTPWLFAVVLDDYRWRRERFGALVFGKGAVEPYFHVQALDAAGAKVPAGAPWLPAADLAYLVATTDSAVPVVRADWFLNRTAIQEGRDGFGYLDFLELKSRADAEALAGLDRKKAEERFRRQAAVILDSGVALQSRQLFRFDTVGGVWWESRDVRAETAGRDDKNAVRRLLADYKHDAEEIVAELPNRLPFYYLSDDKGTQIRSAPPDIASDGRSPTNDRRVHVGLSCVRCHTRAGLIPFDDLFRPQFAAGGPVALGSPDRRKLDELKSVYLDEIVEPFERDAAKFGRAVTRASGLTPAGLAAAYARQWSRYLDEPVGAARAAAECGLTEADFLARLRAWAAAARAVDPVLAAYLTRDPGTVRREHFEEVFPLLMTIVGGTP